jgi:hypothetical protein
VTGLQYPALEGGYGMKGRAGHSGIAGRDRLWSGAGSCQSPLWAGTGGYYREEGMAGTREEGKVKICRKRRGQAFAAVRVSPELTRHPFGSARPVTSIHYN